MAALSGRTVAIGGALIAATLLALTTVAAQEPFQFVISARDATGQPVIDLKPDDIVMSEGAVANTVAKIEPFHIPVKLTIAVDNGILSRNALGHYRTGLDALIKTLPPEVEVTVVTMAPQPRMVIPPTTDRARLLKAVNGFAPEDATPRFADTIVEFAKRLQDEYAKTKRLDSIPVLLLISTTSPETTSYQARQIDSAIQFIEARKARVYTAMTTTNQGADTGQQPMLAMPLTKATHGRYEALADTARLATLLPEFGAEIATLHQQRYNQLLVTVTRHAGATGPPQNVRIELTRTTVTAQVSPDGMPPN